MKQKLFSAAALFGIIGLTACQNSQQPEIQHQSIDLYNLITDTKSGFDSTFAQKTGADEYGMKPYVMAFLKRGPNRSQDSVTAAGLQKAHLDNIIRMAEAGQLVLAGPFMDDGDVRGIYVFNVASVEEARKLTETDPAVQAGRLVMELHPWYGPAALPLITPLSKRLEKKSVAGD